MLVVKMYLGKVSETPNSEDGFAMRGRNGNGAAQWAKAGRPTALTSETAETIIELVRKGNFLETASVFAGVTSRTVRNWMAKGKDAAYPELAEFRRRLLQAQAEAEIRDLAELNRYPSWQAVAWRLERRNPERWGRHRIYSAGRRRKPKPHKPIADVAQDITQALAQLRARSTILGGS